MEVTTTPFATLHELVERNLIPIFVLSVVYWVVISYSSSEARKLRHIPTVGFSAPVLSYLGAFKFMLNARDVIRTGMEKAPDSMFKVAGVLRWLVVIKDPKVVDEFRMLPETIVSPREVNDELLQPKFTLGEHLIANPYHMTIVRAQLTRAIPRLAPAVHDEVVDAFKELIPAAHDWTSIKMLETATTIVTRASNRVFVGAPLCRDPDYINLNVQLTVAIIKTGTILRHLPRILRPMVNALITHVPKHRENGLKHLAPVLAARRKEREEKGEDYPEKPLDLLSLLMDAASDEERIDPYYLTSRILVVNVAAIHTTSMTFTHALYYLAAYQEYMQPLREEVEEVVKEHGWTKVGLDQMHRIDSFIKESQRLSSLTILVMNRVMVKDHVFSDGTAVPKGTNIIVATEPIHLDSERYEDPLRFDGFRYAKLNEHAHTHTSSEGVTGAPRKRFDMVSVGNDALGFGIGRHACPGRYLAASAMKTMLAHAVVTYDVKMAEAGARPADMWVAASRVPNPSAQVLFRKRM